MAEKIYDYSNKKSYNGVTPKENLFYHKSCTNGSLNLFFFADNAYPHNQEKYDYRNKETDNSRNGHSSKTMHTSYGDMDVAIPRDRNGDYEPQLIKKYQNTVTQDMEEKILSMYAKGMTTGDIESHMRELYDIDISDSTISRITDKILPIVKEWQERPLEEVYAVVFMDAIHYHVRSEGRIVKRAVYIALVLN